ncbi:PAS domain S-box protein [Brevibacillus dissolubilis]|uniref:PAS domain S-box protein n=1 Tax=Brevibacillus dissolubilis TaxID=1844116 RepID=UPI0011168977|nr:PAS domain S-box protein [Brevibacillus dissolubilis]
MQNVQLQTETLFHHAFQHAAIGMALVSDEGRFFQVNPSLCVLVGYTEEELLNVSFQDITHPEDLAKDLEFLEQLQDGLITNYQMEKRYIHKDGHIVWALLSASLLRDQQGTPQYLMAQIQDISQRKKAEQLLQEREQRYKSLFQNNPDLVYSFTLDGELESVNGACERITGYRPEELFAITPMFLEEDMRQLIREYDPTQCSKVQHYEICIPHKEGHLIHLDVTNVPILVDGEIIGIYGIAKETTKQHQLVKELRENKERYRLLADYSTDMIVRCGPDGMLLYVSPASEKLVGYKPEEVIGTNSESYIHPKDLPEIMPYHRGEAEITEKRSLTFRFRKKDGTYLWIEANCNAVRENATGPIIEIVSVFRDITERIEREEALRKSEKHLALAQRIAHIGSWDWNIESDELVSSDEFHNIMGTDQTSIYSLATCLPYIHPDDRPHVERAIQEGIEGDYYYADFRIIRSDGTIRFVEELGKVIEYEDGRPVRMIGTTQDLTLIRQEQQKRKDAEELYTLISENCMDMIGLNTPDGIIQYVSPAVRAALGYEPEEMIGTRVMDYYHLDDQLSRARSNRGENDHEIKTCRIRHKDGTYIWFETTFKAIRNEKGEVEKILGVARDISKRIKAEEELMQKELMLRTSEKLSVVGQMAAGIAHEIRNPLTSLKGFLQLMISGVSEKETYYRIMQSELNRIEEILNELLVLSKPQEMRFGQKDLQTILLHVNTLLETQAIMNNIEIVTNLYPEEISITCDENQLKQVFINMVKNAIEAMPDGGTIHISLCREDETAVIQINDQGIGIPEEILSKIGQPFFTTKEKGTGLGLMVSNSIIEKHQGKMSIQSKLGVGTTFTVILPIS